MLAAVQSAQEGIEKGHGGPFGASIFDEQGNLVSVGHNTVMKDKDPTCHAEMNAIRQACRQLGTHILKGCTLYTTAEPCPMCLSAIYWSRIDKVRIGVPRECAAQFGFDDAEFYKEVSLPLSERAISFTTGILQKECEDLFRNWKDLERPLY